MKFFSAIMFVYSPSNSLKIIQATSGQLPYFKMQPKLHWKFVQKSVLMHRILSQ